MVNIDGRSYQLRSLRTLEPSVRRALRDVVPRMMTLFGKYPLTADEAAELTEALAGVAETLLDAPLSVVEQLTDSQRIQVLEHFEANCRRQQP